LEDRLALNNGPVGPTVDVSQRPGNEWNPAIAVDPTHPSHLFAVSNWDNQASTESWGNGLFAAYSTNGGATWTSRALAAGSDGLPLAMDGGLGESPSVSWDQYGNLFLAYAGQVNGTEHAVLALSTDGGQTFKVLSSFGDLAGAESKVATAAGTVWVAFRNWDGGGLNTVHLEAAGARVTGLGQVGAFSSPDRSTANRMALLDDLAVGPSGQAMITFHLDYVDGGQHPVTIYTALDPDGLGPAGFNGPQAVTTSNVDLDHPILPSGWQASANLASGLAWDQSPGPHRGRLYLVYTDASTPYDPATNVYIRYSDDNGASWSGPIRVNQDTGGNSHFLPRIAVDPVTGWVAISWYGPAAAPAEAYSGAQLYATVSVSGQGLAFLPQVVVAAGPSRPVNIPSFIQWPPNTFGGNTGLAFYAGKIHPAWADDSWQLSGNPDPAHFDIATAVVSAPWIIIPGPFGLPPVTVYLPGNPDPLSLVLADWLYVLLTLPDPPPEWGEQSAALTPQAPRASPAALGPSVTAAVFLESRAGGTDGIGFSAWTAASAGGTFPPEPTMPGPDWTAAFGGQESPPEPLQPSQLI
jgi:hypothetical protein